jgi:hypothetical protein
MRSNKRHYKQKHKQPTCITMAHANYTFLDALQSNFKTLSCGLNCLALESSNVCAKSFWLAPNTHFCHNTSTLHAFYHEKNLEALNVTKIVLITVSNSSWSWEWNTLQQFQLPHISQILCIYLFICSLFNKAFSVAETMFLYPQSSRWTPFKRFPQYNSVCISPTRSLYPVLHSLLHFTTLQHFY